MKERLQKLISARGLASRRKAEEWIAAGRVCVNGRPAALGDSADPEADDILVDGKPLPERNRSVYLMLHKPRGYVTTLSDERGRKDVARLVKDCPQRVYPIGRLDQDSEGLLLFTNDGALAHRLISPRCGIEKTYYAEHEGTVDAEDIRVFAEGCVLRDGTRCLPAKLEPLADGKSLVRVREGKYHQVRRMLASRGKPVRYLRRIAEGGIDLGELPVGMTREATEIEIKRLETVEFDEEKRK